MCDLNIKCWQTVEALLNSKLSLFRPLLLCMNIIQNCKILVLAPVAGRSSSVLHFTILLSFSFGVRGRYTFATVSLVLRFPSIAWTLLIPKHSATNRGFTEGDFSVHT